MIDISKKITLRSKYPMVTIWDVLPYKDIFKKYKNLEALISEQSYYQKMLETDEGDYANILPQNYHEVELTANYSRSVNNLIYHREDRFETISKIFQFIFSILAMIVSISISVLAFGIKETILVLVPLLPMMALPVGIIIAVLIHFSEDNWKKIFINILAIMFEVALAVVISVLIKNPSIYPMNVNQWLITLSFVAPIVHLILIFIFSKLIFVKMSSIGIKKILKIKEEEYQKELVEAKEKDILDWKRNVEKRKQELSRIKEEAPKKLIELSEKIENAKEDFHLLGYSSAYKLLINTISSARTINIPNLPKSDDEIIAEMCGYAPRDYEGTLETLLIETLWEYKRRKEENNRMIDELASDIANLITGKR